MVNNETEDFFVWQKWNEHIPNDLPNPSNEKYTSDLTGDFMIEKYMEDVEKFFAPKTEEAGRGKRNGGIKNGNPTD